MSIGARMAAAKQAFVAVWMRRLAEDAAGLDFEHEDDRATFRGRVRAATGNLRWSGMDRIGRHLGVERVPRSRDGAVRAIADHYMQQRGWQRGRIGETAERPRGAKPAERRQKSAPLTPEMLRTLQIADRHRSGGVLVGKGMNPRGYVEWIYYPTVLSLIGRGLLEHIYGSEGELGGRLTEAGRGVLAELAEQKKTPAQLEAEIAEALRKEKP